VKIYSKVVAFYIKLSVLNLLIENKNFYPLFIHVYFMTLVAIVYNFIIV